MKILDFFENWRYHTVVTETKRLDLETNCIVTDSRIVSCEDRLEVFGNHLYQIVCHVYPYLAFTTIAAYIVLLLFQ